MKPEKHLSPFRLRLRRFRRMKRGYYSFVLLIGTYLLSFFLPFIMSNRAIIVRHEGSYYFPAAKTYFYDTFGFGSENIHLSTVFNQLADDGLPRQGEADYRQLKRELAEQTDTGNFAILPPIPYHPNEGFLKLEGAPPHSPSAEHWFGTDDRARDILVRLAYGYRISISFALMVTGVAYTFGILAGAILGFYGRWIDIIGQRLVEIWGAIPFLYTVIILSAIFSPSFLLLSSILSAFGWMGITYYIRGEFYREKSKDYVAAAIATGENNLTIIVRHILPNALTPVITFAPFAIVATIVSLVSLDFLGFGLPAPTASWGELLKQAKADVKVWHMVVFPLGAMFVTLQLVVFIGEAVREAFDPKVFSRLR
jgi:microcin C transport system permease protein